MCWPTTMPTAAVHRNWLPSTRRCMAALRLTGAPTTIPLRIVVDNAVLPVLFSIDRFQGPRFAATSEVKPPYRLVTEKSARNPS